MLPGFQITLSRTALRNLLPVNEQALGSSGDIQILTRLASQSSEDTLPKRQLLEASQRGGKNHDDEARRDEASTVK